MRTHLPLRTGVTLCDRPRQLNRLVSGDMRDVDCLRCWTAWEREMRTEEDAAFDRRKEAEWAAAADYLGVRHLWDRMGNEHATERLMRGILGAVFTGLREMWSADQ